jgi:alpha-1,3-rhamnosyltransferase
VTAAPRSKSNSAGAAASPLVTVLTPCFNHERYLDDYLSGLLAQTYETVELIIFDDGSTDSSWEKIHAQIPALERKFARVVAERHDNIGSTQEVQLALSQATGDLLCILESDDYYLPTKLEENVRFLAEHPDVGLVHSDTDHLYPDGIERAHWRKTRGDIPTGPVYEDLLAQNFVMTCAMCCRMDLFREHVDIDRAIRRDYLARDWAYCLDLAKHTEFGYIDKTLARYRIVAGSWSRPRTAQAWSHYHRTVLRMRVDYADDPAVPPVLAARVKHEYHHYMYRHGLALGQPADCLEGYRGLRARDPSTYGKLRHRLAARAVRLQVFWRIADRLGVTAAIWHAWRALKSRRDRRARRQYLEPLVQ